MASQHYWCPNCQTLELVTYTLSELTQRKLAGDWPPLCSTPECFEVRLEFAPQQMRTDLRTDGGTDASFQKFGVWRDVPTKEGRKQVYEEIDSLHKLRAIERDSEQRYRNGEGEPLRFRMAAQNRSNKDVGLFGKEGQIGGQSYDSGSAPTKRMGITRHGQKKPRISVAKHGGVTALKE